MQLIYATADDTDENKYMSVIVTVHTKWKERADLYASVCESDNWDNGAADDDGVAYADDGDDDNGSLSALWY